jgi:hypothetical protein
VEHGQQIANVPAKLYLSICQYGRAPQLNFLRFDGRTGSRSGRCTDSRAGPLILCNYSYLPTYSVLTTTTPAPKKKKKKKKKKSIRHIPVVKFCGLNYRRGIDRLGLAKWWRRGGGLGSEIG